VGTRVRRIPAGQDSGGALLIFPDTPDVDVYIHGRAILRFDDRTRAMPPQTVMLTDVVHDMPRMRLYRPDTFYVAFDVREGRREMRVHAHNTIVAIGESATRVHQCAQPVPVCDPERGIRLPWNDRVDRTHDSWLPWGDALWRWLVK
jgi:hypothetical protein